MARNTSLFLRISEGKNLPAKDMSGTSDPYCVIRIDNEQIARTATVWRSLNPFWGEEYIFHLPNGFHQLAIYVYDEDLMSGDDIIGTIIIPRDMVQDQPRGVEKWLPLTEVDHDKEIQGEIHLEIRRTHTIDKHILWIKIIEARDLAAKDYTGAADPYVTLSYMGEEQHTHKIKASRFPSWNEEFEVELSMETDDDDPGLLTLTVWDWDRIGGDDFMGRIELRVGDLACNQHFNQWFVLAPRSSRMQEALSVKKKSSNGKTGELGTLRVRLQLTEERILPSQYYSPLIQVLMDSVSPNKHDLARPTPLKMLQEVNSLDLMELANTLVKLYLGQGKIKDYLDVICTEEILSTTTPSTLFRGNSLATKSVDQFMKIVGMPYLHETLSPVIEEVCKEHKYCELDPSRLELNRSRQAMSRRPSLRALTDKNTISRSVATLTRYCVDIRTRITSSISHMPPALREVFKMLHQRNAERWTAMEHEEQGYLAVSGFLFLRFLVPAILSPKLFSLRSQHPDARTSRTLTLLAKAVQSMGNLGLQMGKEQWMEPLHPVIIESVKHIKTFIDKVVSIENSYECFNISRRRSVFSSSIVIKQGYLAKKRWMSSSADGSDKSLLSLDSRFSLNRRYFWLKQEGLSYGKRPSDPVRTTILTRQVVGIERVDKFAFSRSNMAQILIQNNHGQLEILYIQAKDINDLFSWISSIRKMVLMNPLQFDMYHAGAYRSNKWSCCLKHQSTAAGCSKTHSQATLGDWRDPLDPDVEAQNIYAQLQRGQHILRQKYLDSTEAVKRNIHQVSPLSSSPGSAADPGYPIRFSFDEQPYSPNTSSSSASGSTNPSPNPNSFFEKRTSFQDAQIGSAGQLLDVVLDLEKAHTAFERMEMEKVRGSLCFNKEDDSYSCLPIQEENGQDLSGAEDGPDVTELSLHCADAT